MLPWLSSRKLERGVVWGPAQESHEFGNGLLWRPFPSGFSGVRQTELRFAKLILALRHHPWINKSNERTKIVNHFIAFPLKMFSSAWTFLAANTILWVISTIDNPDFPQKLRNRGIFISGLPWWHSCQRVCLQCRKHGFHPWVGKIPGGGHGNPLQYSCLRITWTEEASGYGPWGYKELDTTERLILLYKIH